MRSHRQLRQRLARIECQQSRLPDDPAILRQRMISTVRRSMPENEAVELVNALIAMPPTEARKLIQAELDRRTMDA